MLRAIRICLFVLGASAIGIALSILLLGAETTASLAEWGFGAVSGWRGPPSEHWPPTMDSELRFYAALWGAYGIVVLRAALNLADRLSEVPWLAGVFFAGGVGRVLSRLSTGAPHPFFTLLMTIELVLPVVLIGLWLGAQSEGCQTS
jgi:hypothetical protein